MEWISDNLDDRRRFVGIMPGGTGRYLSPHVAHMMRGLHRLGAFLLFNRDIPQSNFRDLDQNTRTSTASFDARFCAAISQWRPSNENIRWMILWTSQFANLLSANALKVGRMVRGPNILYRCIGRVRERRRSQDIDESPVKGFSSLLCSFEFIVVAGQNPTFSGHGISPGCASISPRHQSTTIKSFGICSSSFWKKYVRRMDT